MRRTRSLSNFLCCVASLALAGCVHFDSRDRVHFQSLETLPYSLNGTAEVRVRDQHLIVPPDLHVFTNPAPPGSTRSTLQASLASAYFVVINRGDRTLLIRVRAMPGEWTDFAIGSGESLAFSCTPCTEHWVQIAIPSAGHPTLVRTIGLQDRYEIFWDDSGKLWDVRPIR
jgi:hypothetical protein